MKKTYLYVSLIFLVYSCDNTKTFNNKIVLNDTIYQRPNLELANFNCYKIAKGYFNRFGLAISNFYEIDQVLVTDLNNDSFLDTIAILNPLSLIGTPEKGGICYSDSIIDNRLLIVSMNINNHNDQPIQIFDNFLSNCNPYLGIQILKANKNNLLIEGSEGSSIMFYYNIYISNFKNKLFIDSIELFNTKSINKINISQPFEFHKFGIEKYDRSMIDSLRNLYDI